jgi:hypothetical protein
MRKNTAAIKHFIRVENAGSDRLKKPYKSAKIFTANFELLWSNEVMMPNGSRGLNFGDEAKRTPSGKGKRQ